MSIPTDLSVVMKGMLKAAVWSGAKLQLTEVREGDMMRGGFSCRLCLPQLEIPDGVVGFEKVEEIVNGQLLGNALNGESRGILSF
jgi:hypothetical protein